MEYVIIYKNMLQRRCAMKKELEQYFGCNVRTEKYVDTLSLPIFMAMREMELVELYGVKWIMVDILKETELTVNAMKKQRRKYENVLKYPIAYKVTIDNLAMRNAMVKNGIAFVDLPENVFLPFLGVVLQDVYRKQNIKTDKMMPATQMVFLELLYQESNSGLLKSEMAKRLNLTKTSITRATAQLVAMGLIEQKKSGTEISIKRNYPRREYFERAKEYLINPIQKMITVAYDEDISDAYKAGETALGMSTSLNPPAIEEIALYKGEEIIDQLELVDIRYEDWPHCVKVQLWKYAPCYFAKNGKVDPVSLICSFKDNHDERIEMCIEELLEEL